MFAFRTSERRNRCNRRPEKSDDLRYKDSNLLHRVYNSLLLQSYTVFGRLVLDDGSNYNTGKIIQSYIEEGKIDIRYFYQEN